MAFSFAYSLASLYEKGTRSWLLWLLAGFMSLNITNAMYSIYMLKDVIFAGFALLLFTVFVGIKEIRIYIRKKRYMIFSRAYL